MAWYLNEVVTDLSPIRDILRLYDQTDAFPEETFYDEYQSRLIPLLRQTIFNSDHIDSDDIPIGYQNDEYRWLASGYQDLIFTLGLVNQGYEERGHRYGYELTDIGSQVLNQAVSMPELMKLKLPEWKNDRGLRPYPIIHEILSEFKRINLYPCGGLMLLEILIVLMELNKSSILNNSHSRAYAYEEVYQKRQAYYGHMVGDARIDLVQYSDFLWEELSQDLSNYYSANYPARATLQLMMYAGELTYGPVPNEVFGLVQYVTVAEERGSHNG